MTRTPLTFVIAQFPELWTEVSRLYERDEVFRELCEDYEACSQALARQESNEALKHEYAALRLRLQTELLGRLHDAEQPPSRRQR